MDLEAQVVDEPHHALSSHGAILVPSVLWTHQYESYLHKIATLAEQGRLHWKRFSGHSSQWPKRQTQLQLQCLLMLLQL